jgi:soluble P-type ATPase
MRNRNEKRCNYALSATEYMNASVDESIDILREAHIFMATSDKVDSIDGDLFKNWFLYGFVLL